MKCALITDSTFPESSGFYIQSAVASLEGLGISYDRFIAPSAPAVANLTANYDFILLPRIRSTEFRASIDSTDLDIPVIALTVDSVSAGQLSSTNPGVGTMTNANTDFFVSVPWSSSNFFATFGDRWTLTTGTSFLTIQDTSPIDGSAQTGAGETMGWYATRAGDGNLYCTSIGTDTQPVLAMILKIAYELGDFTKTQMQSLNPLPLFVDQDHITGSNWNADVDLIERFLSRIPDGGVSWCGVTGGTTTGTQNIETTSDAVMAILQRYHDAGKIRFCYHNHFATWDPISGTWPSETETLTKAQQTTNYDALSAAWDTRNTLAGTTMSLDDSSNWHYNPGNNEWGEATLQMLHDKGCRTVRYATSNICSRPCPNIPASPYNALRRKDYIGGMLLIPYNDHALQNAQTTAARWRETFQRLTRAVHFSTGLYLHDEDFIDTQDPASGEFGVELMDQLNDLNDWAGETIKVFANPIDYIL